MTAGAVTEFQQSWSHLYHGQSQPWESLGSLAAAFAGSLDFSVSRRGDLGPDCGYVEATASHHYFERDLAVIFAVRLAASADGDAAYSAIANHVCDLQLDDAPVPILNVQMPESLRQRCAASSLKFLIIGHDEASQVLQAERPRRKFEELVRRAHADPQGCPFVVAGPVSGRSFFGRKEYIRRVAQHRGSGDSLMRNYAVIGPRRAGKTSLLRRMQETIEEQAKHGTAHSGATYLSLRNCDTAAKAMEAILLHVNPRMWKTWTPGEFLRLLRHQYGSTTDHVWLLDECDDAIKDDWKTGQYLCRAFTDNPYNRVVFAGHTGLWQTSEMPTSVLWNSAVKETLYGLDPPDAKDLFEDTFRTRHWHLHDPKAVLDYVVHQTQCMPALLQLYGAATWNHAFQRGDQDVSLQDVQAAERELQFREETVEPLMRHEDPLARLVIYVLLKQFPHTLPLSERQILEAIKELGSAQTQATVGQSLRDLEHIGIVRLVDSHYRFTYPAFPRLLHETHDLGLLRDEALAALRQGK